MFNRNFGDGFERHSARDARFRKFVADGPGIAGFQFAVDPEVDNDEAAQFLAGADKARVEETDVRLNRAREWALCDSLEALEGLGTEFADAETAPEDDEDEMDENDDGDEEFEEGTAVFHSPEVVGVYRDGEFLTTHVAQGWGNGGRLYHELVVEPKLAAVRLVSEVLASAAETKAVTPPVGKYLAATVARHVPGKGFVVDLGGDVEARVRIADEYGHGSWAAAERWLMSHAVGSRVRVKVIRTNGHMEAVLSDRHRRPFWGRRPAPRQQQEARPAH